MPYTESSFSRASSRFTFRKEELGIALVDLWNFGWADGPRLDSLGGELSTERGSSHALRKKTIIEQNIAPAVNELRQQGIQIFHCNHPAFLSRYPQWLASTTSEERAQWAEGKEGSNDLPLPYDYPETEWTDAWRTRHTDDVFHIRWMQEQDRVYEQIRIPDIVEPKDGDCLIFSNEQFHRILRAKGIRVLFYMGFETDECIQNSSYGIRNMHRCGYMTNIVRDCTTTYESAETASGLWRTKVAIEQIEKLWGYSILSASLVQATQ